MANKKVLEILKKILRITKTVLFVMFCIVGLVTILGLRNCHGLDYKIDEEENNSLTANSLKTPNL